MHQPIQAYTDRGTKVKVIDLLLTAWSKIWSKQTPTGGPYGFEDLACGPRPHTKTTRKVFANTIFYLWLQATL